MVKSLVEVPKMEPFCGGLGHLSTIMDLDEVLCESGRKNTTHRNIAKLAALRSIAKNSDIITFYSSRMRVNYKNHPQGEYVTYFPFFNLSSENFLRDMTQRFNPDCRVDFKVDFLRKIRKGEVEEVEQLVRENLKQGRKVVFIGSNRNDIRVAKKIVTNIEEPVKDKIYVFNTSHWII